jgi:hypothetical protein
VERDEELVASASPPALPPEETPGAPDGQEE